MKKILLLASLLAFTSSLAIKVVADELDDERSVSNQELQGTVIVRVDIRDNSAAYLKSETKLASEDEAKKIITSAEFLAMDSSNNKSELDRDGGSSSWYFYNNYNYNYYMYWYGSYYNPIYTYNYGYYQYYYYCRNRWWY